MFSSVVGLDFICCYVHAIIGTSLCSVVLLQVQVRVDHEAEERPEARLT